MKRTLIMRGSLLGVLACLHSTPVCALIAGVETFVQTESFDIPYSFDFPGTPPPITQVLSFDGIPFGSSQSTLGSGSTYVRADFEFGGVLRLDQIPPVITNVSGEGRVGLSDLGLDDLTAGIGATLKCPDESCKPASFPFRQTNTATRQSNRFPPSGALSIPVSASSRGTITGSAAGNMSGNVTIERSFLLGTLDPDDGSRPAAVGVGARPLRDRDIVGNVGTVFAVLQHESKFLERYRNENVRNIGVSNFPCASLLGCSSAGDQSYVLEGGVELSEGSPAVIVFDVLSEQREAIATDGDLRIAFLWRDAGDGDWLSIQYAGQNVWSGFGTDYVEGVLHELVLGSDAFTDPGLLTFALYSVGERNASVLLPRSYSLRPVPLPAPLWLLGGALVFGGRLAGRRPSRT